MRSFEFFLELLELFRAEGGTISSEFRLLRPIQASFISVTVCTEKRPSSSTTIPCLALSSSTRQHVSRFYFLSLFLIFIPIVLHTVNGRLNNHHLASTLVRWRPREENDPPFQQPTQRRLRLPLPPLLGSRTAEEAERKLRQ